MPSQDPDFTTDVGEPIAKLEPTVDTMATLAVPLSLEHFRRLEEAARRRDVSPSEVAGDLLAAILAAFAASDIEPARR